MLPRSIRVARFKSFRFEAELELRPLTLIYGRNNEGKSALLRLLPLIADSARSLGLTPFDPASPALGGARLADLRFKGLSDDEPRDVAVGLTWDDASLSSAELRLSGWRPSDLPERTIVKSLELFSGGALAAGLEHVPRPGELAAWNLSYRVTRPEQADEERPIGFTGIVPSSEALRDAQAPLVAMYRDRLETLAESVQWLRAVRSSAPRTRPQPEAPVRFLESDGRNCADVLFGRRDVLDHCSAFLRAHLQREVLVPEAAPGEFRVILRRTIPGGEPLDVDLIDSGDGPNQVLPVLVALAMHALGGTDSSPVVAVEEPESHLHPSLQRALADHICEVVRRTPTGRVVLETHSQLLLLGVQLAVARGDLSPGSVALHWVNQAADGVSYVDHIELNEKGELEGAWPPDVYDDPSQVARELLKARRTSP